MDRIPNHVDMNPQKDVFDCLTVVSQKTTQPAMPEGSQEGTLRGLHRLRQGAIFDPKPRVQLLGNGAILGEILAASELLERDFDVFSDVWSVTSYTELWREGMELERWNRLHPTATPRTAFVQRQLAGSRGPVIAATDEMHTVPDQIRPFITDRRFVMLGTDGFGPSDTRQALPARSEVTRHQIVVAALQALADDGLLQAQEAADAIVRFGMDPEARPAAVA